MNEDIIGYVMGALDAQEHQRIEDLMRGLPAIMPVDLPLSDIAYQMR